MPGLLSISRAAGILVACVLLDGCGDSSSPSASPGPTPLATTPVLLTLSGVVTDDAGGPVGAAIVTVVDGLNAGKAAITDSAGRYSLTDLSAGGFSIRVRRDGFDDHVQGVTLTSASSVDVSLSRSRLNLTGAMSGTFAFTYTPTGGRFAWPATAAVTQSDRAIAGTLRIQPTGYGPEWEWTGSFTGTLSSMAGIAEYSGSLTITAPIDTGNGRCNGTRSSHTGTASATQMTLSLPGFFPWTECVPDRENVVITLNKPVPAGPRSR